MNWDQSFDLKLLDAETMKEYGPEDLIPKNSSVILMRVPLLEPKNHRKREIPTAVSAPSEISSKQPSNLVEMQCSEQEKVDLMMAQSTYAYAPSNYLKVPFNNSGKVPSTYVCKRCHQKGHWYQNCTFTINGKPASIRKASGIPRTMAKVVEGPEVPGAMITATGEYIVYAPELISVVKERGTPKMPLPVKELKLLRKSDEIKKEAKDPSLSPPSGGEDTEEAVNSSDPNEQLESTPMAWNGYSDDSYKQSSNMDDLRQDGGSYEQSGLIKK
ncbi:Similar to RBBP6: E3 ubiquitin-protein ligase RBBP6 (Homo sapiens) [Cotesia congregata]|uniref:Similar to RBBP6: E3 ubiquitin-protein ligase RBBP6 (Homo sapiens) n=1 Tax=Cotesia congregata TaxID=51543 RepID=A0A8J2H752_COTCN|nr:Similar to RBBP6: E3 ubiquitin-protein ligase RBBP6 (Homo sapiens) [Cotesia congregata]